MVQHKTTVQPFRDHGSAQDHSSNIDHNSGPGISAADRVDHAAQGNSGGNSRPPLDLHRPIVTPREQPSSQPRSTPPAQHNEPRYNPPAQHNEPRYNPPSPRSDSRGSYSGSGSGSHNSGGGSYSRGSGGGSSSHSSSGGSSSHVAEADLHRIAAVVEEATANRTQAPAPPLTHQVWWTKAKRATDNQPSLFLFFKDEADLLTRRPYRCR